MIKETQPAIRVLHLFSNSKWTGPAEPAVNLCGALRRRGIDVDFACAPEAGSGYNKVQAMARRHGMEPLGFMNLSKHRSLLKNWQDARALRRHLMTTAYDLIHCHLDNDTAIALRAASGLSLPVVRSSYEGTGFARDRRHHYFMRKCDAVIEPSHRARQEDDSYFRVGSEKLHVADAAVDTERFNPGRPLPDMRRKLGIPPDAFVFGIVARIQAHRHYEDLFMAFADIMRCGGDLRLVIIGRGTRQEEIAFRPVKALGLEERVHFTGYLDGDDYVGAVAAMDAGLFLTPGTDGTCRAVREMMSMNIPMITSDRGMLAEIVTHETDGLVTDGSSGKLRAAMRLLYENPSLRRQYGAEAGKTARARYTVDRYTDTVLKIYRILLEARKSGTGESRS